MEQNSGRIFLTMGAVLVLGLVVFILRDSLPDMFKYTQNIFDNRIPKF